MKSALVNVRRLSILITLGLLAACSGADTTTDTPTSTATAEDVATATAAPTASAAPVVTATATASEAPQATATTPPKPAIPDGKLDTATFTRRASAVGDKETVESLTVMKMAGTINDPKAGAVKFDTDETETVSKVEECLKVDAGSCVQIKVTYKNSRKKGTTMGEAIDEPSPVVSKSYVVEKTADGVKVTKADGSEPPKAELKEVSDDYKSFADRGKMKNVLPEKPIKVGDSLDEAAKAMAGLLGGSSKGLVVKEAKLKVKDLRVEGGRKIATLDVKITVDSADPNGTKAKVSMTGTVDLLIDSGETVKTNLTGPLDVTMPKNGGRLTGTTSKTSTHSYNW